VKKSKEKQGKGNGFHNAFQNSRSSV